MKSFVRRAVSAVLGLVAIASMATLVAAAPAGASTTSATTGKPAWFTQGLRWPVVSPGARGERVVTIQYLLQQRGFHNVRADGVYGPITTRAVKSFQRQHGLRASGVVRSSTWNRLILTLHRGDRGSAVRAVQHSLKFAYGFRFVRVNGNYYRGTWLRSGPSSVARTCTLTAASTRTPGRPSSFSSGKEKRAFCRPG